MIREEAKSDDRLSRSHRTGVSRDWVPGPTRTVLHSSGWPPPHSPRRSFGILVVFAAIAVAASLVSYWHSRSMIVSEDGVTVARIHPISSRIAGTVLDLRVEDRRPVAAGEALVALDRRDGELALQRAKGGLARCKAQALASEAAVTQAQAEIGEREAGVHLSQAQVVEAAAHWEKTQLDFNRSSGLFQQDVKAVAKAEVDAARGALASAQGAYDAARADLEAARALVAAAHSHVQSAEAQVALSQAAVDEAAAAVGDAELQLSYTTITTPVAGRIANATVQTGQQLLAGQTVMSVMEEPLWVVASLKEADWERVQVGQGVQITLNALPRQKFRGRVDALQPELNASGRPPTADPSGKTAPRLPVKIVFDQDSLRGFEDKVAPGLTATVRIDLTSR
jgi:membrane fusion protein (multidrug efflux system)